MPMNERDAVLFLSQTAGLSNAAIRHLLVSGVSFAGLLRDRGPARQSSAMFDPLVSRELVKLSKVSYSQSNTQKILEECQCKRMRIMTIVDHDYPVLLKEIYDPPAVLYVKGSLIPEDKAAIAIVGSRYASPYGLRTSFRMAYELAEAGVTVISGLARGIDSEAHRGALKARGRTIAVLGCGLDVIYPPEHKKLYLEISESGALISEFPPGTPPKGVHFPSRNRIIAGLTLGTLVVEAHQRSGSLITASLSADEGREVYVIPGAVDSIHSRGANALIQQGAKLVQQPDDILEDLRFVLKDCLRPESQEAPVSEISQIDSDNKTICADDNFLNLFCDGPLVLDEIQTRSRLDRNRLHYVLTQMELEKKLIRKPGGYFDLISRR